MRRRLAPLLPLSTSLLVLAALVPAAEAAPRTDPGLREVSYRGFTVTIPSSWPVYDLEADPSRCVRFDVNAVYLGHPGKEQQCPVRAAGRAEAILLEPYDDIARQHVDPGAGVNEDDGTIQVLSADQRVMVTAASPAGANAARRLLTQTPIATVAPTRAAPTVELPPSDPPVTTQKAPASNAMNNLGFDACAAPSTGAMADWRRSPYRTVGIYIGGVNRACGYGNLTTDWVRTVYQYGFTFLPIYVGPQAPCSGIGEEMPTDPQAVVEKAKSNAYGAVLDMQIFGMRPGNPVYLDIEHYDPGACNAAATVKRYVAAWTAELHRRGYVSGVYSSQMGDINAMYDSANRPDAIWIARWDGDQSVYGDPVVPDSRWAPHQRVKQYYGGHNETYGSATINIDSNKIDGPIGFPGGWASDFVNLGGAPDSGPDASTRGGGTMVVASRFTDNRVYIKYWDTSSGRWSHWKSTGLGTVTNNPAVVAVGAGRIWLLARRADGHLVYAWQRDGGWHGWKDLGGCIVGSPAAVRTGGDAMIVAARGCGKGSVFLKTYSGAGRWGKFYGRGGPLTADPGLAYWGSHLEVFGRGSNGDVIRRGRSGGNWGSWQSLGGSVQGGPDAATLGPGSVDVYVREAGSSRMMRKTLRPSRGWWNWEYLEAKPGTDPAAAAWDDTRAGTFYKVGSDVLHRWYRKY